MKLSRRGFLSASALLGASYFEQSYGINREIRDQRYAICQRDTDFDRASFSILVPNGGFDYKIEVENSAGALQRDDKVESIPYAKKSHRLYRVQFMGLRPHETYTLKVSNPKNSYVERRTFQTLDFASSKAKVALLSCMNDFFHRDVMWQKLEQHNPDVLFFLGDAVYADMTSLTGRRTADPPQLQSRFVQAWNKIDFYKWPHLKPVYAVWDDHDFGSNNSNRNYPHAEFSKANFRHFYGPSIGTRSTSLGPGVSFSLSAYGQQFIFLDGRTFRTEEGASTESLFGKEQEDWAFSQLVSGSGPAWLLSGSQWFGGYLEKESYEFTHPNSFQNFLQMIRSTGRHVSFVSGDVHFSEIMEIESEILGYDTLELTASSLHSLTIPGWHRLFRNPRRVNSTSKHNFLLLELDSQSNEQCISCIGRRRRPFFKYERT